MRHNINYQDFAFTNLEIANKGLLNSWVITRLLPNMQRINVASFRSRSHAEVYLRNLRQLIPDADFVMIFDCQRE
ncbi:hypothetical protein CLI64_12175 [Nostoc sp. CENA543]|uniref:hypothetical protein n=1 Tax=Nostoc sp. CENA543 TaxID=1869241 RepID=UPI000CA34057|nr:hypothetical protein [Nostoc sp. CENA543]AUT01098.1 hypothetical protein CLI64_12175 [Nostoc sp. CENA543]